MPSRPPRSSYAVYAVSALTVTGSVASAHAHGALLLQPRSLAENNMNQKRGQLSYSGCYSSSDGLTDLGSYMYQSSGYCQQQCQGKNQPVLGLSSGSNCWCGETIPEASSKVDDSKCNSPCTGYGQDDCGGNNYWSVYLTGTESNVPNYSGSASSAASSTSAPTSSATTSAPSTVITSVAPGTTVVVTEPAAQITGDSSPTPSASSKHSSDTAGIAAGVVVGVVALAAIIAGAFFWIRHKKKQEAEEDYKRTQVSSFIKGGEVRPPPTAYSQMSDSRLDPQAGRRNSSGSIADDQDYSRRILRVANPS